jgi:hypothetical protein
VPQGTASSGGPVGTPATIAALPPIAAFRSIMPLTCTLTVGDCWPVMVAMNPPRTFHRTPLAPEPQESSPGSPAALG